MPLIKSSSKEAFSKNVSEMMHTGHPQDQALAAAYRIKRQGRADGGRVHTGSILSGVPGRTDLHPMHVKSGSYVLPADHVSSLGQGNTIAGLSRLNKMFNMGPYGAAMPKGKRAHLPKFGHAKGGGVEDHGEPTPINAAGGEFVIPPEKILEWMESNGFHPDLDAGHKELDRWVVENRKKHAQTLSKLPGPARS
jgi:hypothetical protein